MGDDFLQARRRLPLRQLLAQHGHDPAVCARCGSPATIEEVVSGTLSDSFIDAVKGAIDIERVARVAGLDLKKSGSSLVALCPFHSEKSGSFNISTAKRMFKCFGCNMGGDGLSLFMELTKTPFVEAVCRQAAEYGIQDDRDRRQYQRCMSPACDASQDGKWSDEVGALEGLLKMDRRSAAVTYLQEAGIKAGDRLPPSVMPGQRPRRSRRHLESAASEYLPSSDEATKADASGSAGATPPESPVDSPAEERPSAQERTPTPKDPPSPPPAGQAEQHAPEELDGAMRWAHPADEDELRGSKVHVTSDEAAEAVQWFYSKLEWREAEAAAIYRRRGLTPNTCRVFGLRSNHRGNYEALVQAAERFSVGALLKVGLYAPRRGDEVWIGDDGFSKGGARPSEFFFGKGVAGMAKDSGGKDIPIYNWNESPLIPYWNNIPSGPSESFGSALVTEGEFKAMAIWQIFNPAKSAWLHPGPEIHRLIAIRPHKHWAREQWAHSFLAPGNGKVGVAAIPGITFVRRAGGSWMVRRWLDAYLETAGCRHVMIVFDNDDRSKKKEITRHDPTLYAFILGAELRRGDFQCNCRFAQIDKRHRDAVTGKADWDSVLARLISGTNAEPPPDDSSEPEPMIYEFDEVPIQESDEHESP